MKEKILYIDLLSPHGHIFFNNIYINALLKCNYDIVDFVFQSHYKGSFEHLSSISKYRYFPSFKSNKIPRLNAIKLVLYLLIFQLRCMYIAHKGKYSKIIFSSFDNYTIKYFYSKADIYAICHNNIERVICSEKQNSFFLSIPKKIKLIVLNSESYNYLKSIGYSNTYYFPHGYLDRNLKCSKKKKIIYIPINDFIDSMFFSQILSEKFDKYLSLIGYKLLIKKSILKSNCKFENIEILNRHLSDIEYNLFLSESKIILLPYDINKYKYRSSAIFMEAISLNNIIIAPYCNNFKDLNMLGDSGIFLYDDFHSFMGILSDVVNTESKISYNNVKLENSIGEITKKFQVVLSKNNA